MIDQTARLVELLGALDVLYKASNDLDAIVRPNRALLVVETWLADLLTAQRAECATLRKELYDLILGNGTPLKYTAEKDTPCAVCRVTIRTGEQSYRFGNWTGDEPHLWQCLSHVTSWKQRAEDAEAALNRGII